LSILNEEAPVGGHARHDKTNYRLVYPE